MASLARRILHHPLSRLVLCLVIAGLAWGGLVLLAALSGARPGLLTFSLVNAAAVTVALLVVGRGVERKSPAELGLRGSPVQVLGGLVLGAALMAAVVGVLALLGWYRLGEGGGERPQQEALAALRWALIFAVAAFFEEVLFRAIAFRLLEEWLGSLAALILSSLAFGVIHIGNPNAGLFATLAIALEAGLLLGAAFMLTRSLWFVTALHWGWNWVQGSVFGVAVSGADVPGLLEGELVGPPRWTGGEFGAEAGGVALLLATPVGLLLAILAARRGQWLPVLYWRRLRASGEVGDARAAS